MATWRWNFTIGTLKKSICRLASLSIALEVRSPEASAEIPQRGLTSKWASPGKSPKSGQTSGEEVVKAINVANSKF